MSAPVLEIRDVVKSCGRDKALDGVSLMLRPGDHVGLLGPNGAGKSTLFQIVAGLLAPDTGQVRLFGQTHRDGGAAILRRLGVVFQARSIDMDMSVLANLRFHGRLFGIGGRALSDRIAELVAQVGLAGLERRAVRTLSGGQQRRVGIARALINRPDLLRMDEPTAGLDTAARAELVAHMRALAASQGTAVLWATHLVDEVAQASRVVILTRGRVRADDTPAALCAQTGAADLTAACAALTGEPET